MPSNLCWLNGAPSPLRVIMGCLHSAKPRCQSRWRVFEPDPGVAFPPILLMNFIGERSANERENYN